MIRSTHGGVVPQCAQGSIVANSVAPRARSPAASSATISACRPPVSVAPSPTTTPSRTTTAPIVGFGYARPAASAAISTARSRLTPALVPAAGTHAGDPRVRRSPCQRPSLAPRRCRACARSRAETSPSTCSATPGGSKPASRRNRSAALSPEYAQRTRSAPAATVVTHVGLEVGAERDADLIDRIPAQGCDRSGDVIHRGSVERDAVGADQRELGEVVGAGVEVDDSLVPPASAA